MRNASLETFANSPASTTLPSKCFNPFFAMKTYSVPIAAIPSGLNCAMVGAFQNNFPGNAGEIETRSFPVSFPRSSCATIGCSKTISISDSGKSDGVETTRRGAASKAPENVRKNQARKGNIFITLLLITTLSLIENSQRIEISKNRNQVKPLETGLIYRSAS